MVYHILDVRRLELGMPVRGRWDAYSEAWDDLGIGDFVAHAMDFATENAWQYRKPDKGHLTCTLEKSESDFSKSESDFPKVRIGLSEVRIGLSESPNRTFHSPNRSFRKSESDFSKVRIGLSKVRIGLSESPNRTFQSPNRTVLTCTLEIFISF